MNEKIKAALSAARDSAKREAGALIVMGVLSLIAVLVAVPIIFLLNFLPDWAWAAIFSAFVVWLFFGETILAAVRAYRGAP